VGFVRTVVTKAMVQYPRPPGVGNRVVECLDLLDSPPGMLLDYSLRPAPVKVTTLETLARARPVALRERLLGRVVLLPGSSWETVVRDATPAVPSPAHSGEPAAAWAIATALSGSGAFEMRAELLGSALVLLAVVLMLTLGDRGLRGKFLGAAVALAGVTGWALGALVWRRMFIPPCSLVTVIGAAFLTAVCLELAEAGSLIAQESPPETGGRPWAGQRRATRPEMAVEEALRSIVAWHQLPGAALLLRDAARPAGLVVMSPEGSVDWSGEAGLEALGKESLLARAPVVGDWPGGRAKALAVPVILEPGRGAALLLATPRLPAEPDVVAFGIRVVRQLLATRTPRPDVSLTVPDSATRPDKLPLPAQVARLRAERLARQQQAAFAAAWRAGPHEAVIVFDTAGKPVLWNRRAEVLFDGEAGVDLGTAHLVPLLAKALELPEAEVRESAMGVLLHGTPYIGDLEDPEGRCNYVVSLTRVGPDDDTPGGLALRCIDVTGIVRPARVEARLMSVAAHEMRTPLTSVMGYAELLHDQAEDGSAGKRYADAIHRQAKRMEAIVGELLTVTRLEAGREELVVEPVDLALLARQVVAETQPMAATRSIAVGVETAGNVCVRGDVPKLERVAENLVTNAIKYSPEGATVSVRVRRLGDQVALEVQDTGYGISAEDAPHVFEKFYRARNQHTESVEGTGLGLAIVRLIAEAHGGSVSLQTSEGVGSTFTVVLPVRGPSQKRVSDPAA